MVSKGLRKISRQKFKDINSKISGVKVHSAVKLLPVKNPTFNYKTPPSSFRSKPAFEPPEYNLAEIGRVADVDGYFARSLDKKISLMFKEGWSFSGKNLRIVEYIKARFIQIASSTKLPTEELFRKIGDGLIRKSNTLLIKVRKEQSSGGKIRKVSGTKKVLEPVAGYFIPPVETFEVRVSGNEVSKWRQRIPNGRVREFKTDDASLFYYNKKDGFTFGTPTVVPVLDDIRALRKIEENIELLIYQHLFPLFQWKVGTKEAPAASVEGGQTEVDLCRQEIQYMPTEGGIVTTERLEISAIGAEGRALRAEGYLTHFKKRVFAGLDMSPIDFGEGESSNRSTAEQLSQNLIDRVKDVQRVIESFVNENMIKELLLESTFTEDLFVEENIVKFKFREIDLELQIKKDNHHADLFAKNTIGINEARRGMDRDGILLPTPDEIEAGQDGPEGFPGWYELNWSLMERPKLIMQTMKKPWANLENAISSTVENEKEELEIKRIQAEKTPTVSKVKDSSLKDFVLIKQYKIVKSEIIDYIEKKQETDINFISQLIRSGLSSVVDKVNREQALSFKKGYSSFAPAKGPVYIESISLARKHFKSRVDLYVNRLVRDISNSIKRNMLPDSNIASVVGSVFDTFKYRSEFIDDVEIRKAFNYGKVKAMKVSGIKKFIVQGNGESCPLCTDHLGEITETKYVVISDIVPFHAHCDCIIKSYSENVSIGDEIDNSNDIIEDEDVEVENSSRRNKKGAAERVAKKAAIGRCVKSLLNDLKKANPDLDNRTIRALAQSICHSRVNDGEEDEGEI